MATKTFISRWRAKSLLILINVCIDYLYQAASLAADGDFFWPYTLRHTLANLDKAKITLTSFITDEERRADKKWHVMK